MDFALATDHVPGRVSAGFIKVASICALLTALTTLAVHWLPELWKDAATFEAQLRLRHNAIYMGRSWVVLAGYQAPRAWPRCTC